MKNIVICCDGTGNEYGKNNTNVVETYGLAKKSSTQIAYYDPGVGTGGWTYDEESGKLRAFTDQGTGSGLQKNVNDAYRYLMEVYEEQDHIFLFGFSRGAFTVRSLAGMLHKVGLLERNADNHLEYAAKIYNRRTNARVAAGFRATFSRPAPVHFIGVWDTVESLVLNEGKRWADARLNRRSRSRTTRWPSTSGGRTFSPVSGTNGTCNRNRRWSRCGSPACTRTWGAITRNAALPTSRFTGC